VWEGCHCTVRAFKLSNKKIKVMGGPLALDGCRLMGGHNNQPKVGVNSGGGVGDEKQPTQNVWGVLSLFSGRQIEQQKN
jgi:hypothetical protein